MKAARTIAIALALAAAPAAGQTGSDGEAFLAALREGNGTKAFGLAEANGSTVINYRGTQGAALHIVVRKRNANWVGYLLDRGADPDIADPDGNTPLILAARSGFGEAVAGLLRSRAQVDKANKLGETPLIVAVQQRQRAIVSTLLKLGASPDKRDYAGYSAREYARRDTRSTEMLRLIESTKSQQAVVSGPTR